MKRKSSIIILFIYLSLFSFRLLLGQSFLFRCNMPNYAGHNSPFYNSSNDSINYIFDSINKIDFSKEDFEFRLWNHSSGQLGTSEMAFIMKYYKATKGWKAYYFNSHCDNNDSISFNWLEINKLNSKLLESLWDTLVKMRVLLLNNPSQESLSKIPNYSIEDCQSNFSIELIKNNCIFKCDFDGCSYGLINEFRVIPEYKQMNDIIEYLYIGLEQINKTIIPQKLKLESEPYYWHVDESAIFQGGDLGCFVLWVKKNIVYPFQNEVNTFSKVTVQFDVNSKGYIDYVKIIRGDYPILNNEVERCIRSSTGWKSARIKGVNVIQRFVITFSFDN